MTRTQKYSKFPGFPAVIVPQELLESVDADPAHASAASLLAERDRLFPGWEKNFQMNLNGK